MLRKFTVINFLLLGLLVNGDNAKVNNKFSQATSSFSVNLLKVLAQNKDENVAFSPVSIGILLSQLQIGAAGNTKKELDDVLLAKKEVSMYGYSRLVGDLSEKNDGDILSIATKTYLRNDFPINEDFKRDSSDIFKTDIENLDFSATNAADIINNWMKTATNGHIESIFDKGSLDADTVMALVSAIFFKGTWRQAFSPKSSVTDKFFTNPNLTTDATFMTKKGRMYGGVNGELELKWIHLPYQKNYVMLLILPTDPFSLDELIQRLDGENLRKIMSSRFKTYVNLKLPKFSLKVKTPLTESLQRMGLKAMFSSKAEFPGITPNSVKVSNAFHEAMIEVNEEGSVAAAGSGTSVHTLSLIQHDDEMDFVANQPFLAVIFDKVKLVPVFVTKVSKPS